MSIRCEWLTDIGKFEEIAAQWDRAVERSGSYNPFLLSDFIILWSKYFGKKDPLRMLVVYDGKDIAGGIPLCLKKGPGPYGFVNMLCHVGGSAANYTEPLYASKGNDILPSIMEALSGRKDWDLLYLSDLRHGNRLPEELSRGDADKRFSVKVLTDHSNWSIDLSSGLEKYLAGISPKLKRDLRSKRKHLEEKFGPLQLRGIKGAAVAKLIEDYSKLSLNSFSDRGRESSFESREYASFYGEFLMAMEGKGMLDAHLLCAGEEPLAISFGYKFGPGFNWVLTGFNSGLKYYRPGYLLIEELLKLTAGRGEKIYNWYGYERFYKTQWCNRQDPLYRVFIVRRGVKGGLYRALNSLERALRSNKALVNVIRKIRRS